MTDRRATWWRAALRSAERAHARHEALRATMPVERWLTPRDSHILSWAEQHARVAWLLWDARRHTAD